MGKSVQVLGQKISLKTWSLLLLALHVSPLNLFVFSQIYRTDRLTEGRRRRVHWVSKQIRELPQGEKFALSTVCFVDYIGNFDFVYFLHQSLLHSLMWPSQECTFIFVPCIRLSRNRRLQRLYKSFSAFFLLLSPLLPVLLLKTTQTDTKRVGIFCTQCFVCTIFQGRQIPCRFNQAEREIYLKRCSFFFSFSCSFLQKNSFLCAIERKLFLTERKFNVNQIENLKSQRTFLSPFPTFLGLQKYTLRSQEREERAKGKPFKKIVDFFRSHIYSSCRSSFRSFYSSQSN